MASSVPTLTNVPPGGVPTPSNIVTIIGSLADEVLPGTPQPDLIRGDGTTLHVGQRGGDDTITGGDGNDTITGDAATLSGAAGGHDRIDGGDGNDLIYGDATLALPPIVAYPTLLPVFTLLGNDTIRGGDGNDTIYGDALNNVYGSAVGIGGILYGNDLLIGGAGDDVIHGDNIGLAIAVDPPPPVTPATGAQPTLVVRNAEDTLQGGAGNDSLYGDGGHDSLEGGNGKDLLDGGTGNDSLAGGDGADRFVFHLGDGQDVVLDFTSGEDRIVIDADATGPTTHPPVIHIDATSIGLHIGYGDGGDGILLLGVTRIASTDILFA